MSKVFAAHDVFHRLKSFAWLSLPPTSIPDLFMDLAGVYRNKKVLITGHTGFKGSWLSLWLLNMGAEVYGYALEPPTDPSLYSLLGLKDLVIDQRADVRDLQTLTLAISRIKPDIIFHLAAQSVVRYSYDYPLETAEVNAMGTVHVMEAVRLSGISTALVMITTDKVYENKEWLYGYRETDPLGGHDPYSASKSAAEIFISSWRNSFFDPKHLAQHGVRLASARAGNVIGGGDWTIHALVPDCIRQLDKGETIVLRNPQATRPWQHVLEPLSGYLQLGAKLLTANATQLPEYCDAFNFGPYVTSNKSVKELVEKLINYWGEGTWEVKGSTQNYHEANLLHLSIDKAYHQLYWAPRWDLDQALLQTVAWYKMYLTDPSSVSDLMLAQINTYQNQGKIETEIPFV